MLKALLLAAVLLVGTSAAAKPRDVLFVGNSLTTRNEMPRMASALARTLLGRDVRIEVLASDGASLGDHLRSSELQRRLRDRRFDVVVLQDVGGFPLCDPAFPWCSAAEQSLAQAIALARGAGAQVLWFSTWQPNTAAQRALSRLARDTGTRLGVEVLDMGAVIEQWGDLARPALLPDGHPTELGSWIIASAIVSRLSGVARPTARDVEVCRQDSNCLRISAEQLDRAIRIAW